MNHVNVEEVEDQPDAVIGKFLVKSFTALILFDTGASHSYISSGFVDKFNLPTQTLRTPMLVTSPGAEYMANLWCDRLPLRIGNYLFPSDLIVLESQGLDVILGMDWLSNYGGNIECASKSIFAYHARRKKDQVCIPACAKEDSSKFLIRSCIGGSTSGEGFS